ncbi:hypothetical protein PA905_32220 [Planktothrix agardhii CCAP 1459/11A]|jgi:hypothetical protein|uniref:Uncharacterized protein n=1 Tax=Planktothrix agardhii CCAP 1459/11A TaxID=282420 RepID=A0A4P5ZZC7_PLAAG|nr:MULTISPECIES: hypothetical protein [Planktothrix]GDZ95041.1 hypothetical protein PA905_32220 [Planktothrix agardhii CCAP 1459/11A]
MIVIDIDNIRDKIKELTIPMKSYPDDFLGFYQKINNSISAEIKRIKQLHGIDLIIVENLYKDYYRSEVSPHVIIQKHEQETVNIWILGNFEHKNQIVWELSEVFADFYVEFLLMPIFHVFNYNDIKPDLIQEFKQGIIVYECERNLSRKVSLS